MDERIKKGNSDSPITIEIRPIQETDLEPLANVYVDVYTAFDVGESWDTKSAQKMLRFWYEYFPDLALVATHEGKAIGAFLAGVKPWCDGNHLIDGEIFVHPNHQKRGVGSRLTKAMFERAREKYGAVAWDTYTFRGFEHPVSCYKKLGFKELEEWVMISGNIEEALKRLG